MGRVLLVFRLALRDVRRRPVEAALLFIAIVAAATTLSLGLVLRQAAGDPYLDTRSATAGPDVVASVTPPPTGGRADLDGLKAVLDAPEVVGHSGPYPVSTATLKADGRSVDVQAEGRDAATADVDQPKLVEGSWVTTGEVVVEAALADALGVGAGDEITLGGQSYRVAGIAVTAATLPYPEATDYSMTPMSDEQEDSGLVWLTEPDARSLAAPEDLSYVLNLKLADPADAPAFVEDLAPPPPEDEIAATGPTDPAPALIMETWQQTRDNASLLARNAQRVLVSGGTLLALLAMAGVAVLVGGRMADQTRRVGLLKAVGGTPGLVAAVLLAEHVGVSLLAAAAGLGLGWLIAPLLGEPTAGLIGSTGTPPLTVGIVGLVVAMALAVAVIATLVPALRAARTSTVVALADAARPPRRTAWLIAISARLPAPLLLALRVAGRRPRRVALAVLSLTITVTGIVAALALNAQLGSSHFASSSALDDARTERLGDVLLILSVMLIALAAVNTVVITWATVLDARHSSALSRALGMTPHQVTAALSAAQLPATLVGVALGIPGGLALVAAVDPDSTTNPPLWQLIAVVPCTALAVAGLTAIPAVIGARRPTAQILQAERA